MDADWQVLEDRLREAELECRRVSRREVSKDYACPGCSKGPIELQDVDCSKAVPEVVCRWLGQPHEPYGPECLSRQIRLAFERIESLLEKLVEKA